MKKAFKESSFAKKALYVLIEIIILIIIFIILNFLTYLSQYLAGNLSSKSILLILVYTFGIPIIFIGIIYLFNFFGYNYAINSKTGKTFLKIIISLLILNFIGNLVSKILQLRFYSLLASYPIEKRMEILSLDASVEYLIKLSSGELISRREVIIYFIWQLTGIISFAKGALGYYKERES